ncbi:MAG: RNA-binding S4 domain-containing protein [Gallionella sp.]
MNNTSDKLRIDKWLWAARFFKTRSIAVDAIENGRILLDGVRVKPARAIAAGDRLEIRMGQAVFEVEVLALSDKRGPAPVAQKLYRESDESRERRAAIAAQLKLQPEFFTTRGRPTKRDRREIEKFKHGETD